MFPSLVKQAYCPFLDLYPLELCWCSVGCLNISLNRSAVARVSKSVSREIEAVGDGIIREWSREV